MRKCLRCNSEMKEEMNDVNKTLYISLYGKSKVSKQGIILKDTMAEKIWELESFKMKGKSKSKWLSYNMAIPDSNRAVVILEGISMYLKNEQLNAFLKALSEKYKSLSIFVDVYTVWGAKASKYKNPINDVGVTMVWGIDDIQKVLAGTEIVCKEEHSLTPDYLVKKLKPFEQFFFRIVFSERIYRKIYRLYELEK